MKAGGVTPSIKQQARNNNGQTINSSKTTGVIKKHSSSTNESKPTASNKNHVSQSTTKSKAKSGHVTAKTPYANAAHHSHASKNGSQPKTFQLQSLGKPKQKQPFASSSNRQKRQPISSNGQTHAPSIVLDALTHKPLQFAETIKHRNSDDQHFCISSRYPSFGQNRSYSSTSLNSR